jgi:hypothetical protein
MIDVVGIGFGTTWMWGGWPLFHGHLAHVWCQMPQIILWFPYGGMDFWHDPFMVLPPGEDWDQRGMWV